jgi:site-specific DNA-methyltransferase (adenine-specific)
VSGEYKKVEIGNGTFYIGDCFDVMRDLPDGSVDILLTDVPYNAVNRKGGGLRNLDKGVADSAQFDLDLLVFEIGRLSVGSVYVFCGREQCSPLSIAIEKSGFTVRLGVWQKTNPSPMNGHVMWLSGLEFCVFGRKPKAIFNAHCKPALWAFPSQRSKIHPTQKPVGLFQYLIEASSDDHAVVCDPFGGSGTTAIAAENTDRRWICIERDPEYAAKAIDRIRAHVGIQTPIIEESFDHLFA